MAGRRTTSKPLPGRNSNPQLHHRVAAELGKQLVHVTLKVGRQAKRVDRKTIEVSGTGVVEIGFKVPGNVPDNIVQFAAFIGPDYARHLQHIHTDSKSVE